MSLKYDYLNKKVDAKLSWKSVISCISNSSEAVENWQNQMHEVSMRRCARITRSVRKVGAEASELPTYEFFPNLESFLEEFEAKFT